MIWVYNLNFFLIMKEIVERLFEKDLHAWLADAVTYEYLPDEIAEKQ